MYKYFSATKTNNGISTEGSSRASYGNPIVYHGRKQGAFAEWAWDAENKQLTAEVDTLGLHSLFYYADRDRIMVSVSPVQLIAAGAPADPDPRALAVFYLIGWQVEQDTPFKYIKVLPPNGKLVWKDGVLTVTGKKDIEPERALTYEAAVDGFIDHFRLAVKSHLDTIEGDIVLPLSGGRDSRHILFEMMKLGRPPVKCMTHGIEKGCDPDFAAARDVAKALNIPHETVNNRASPTRDLMQVVLITHFCSDESAPFLGMRRHLGRMNPRPVMLDGLAGDILSRNKSFANPEMHALCRQGQWEKVFDEGLLKTNNFIQGCTFEDRANALAKPYFDEARSYIIEHLKTYAGAADPFSAFLFWTRTRREISLIPISILSNLGANADVRIPYLDLDLVAFLMSIPFSISADGKFHDKVIEVEFPEYASLKYQDQYEPNYIRPSLPEKLRALAEGISAAIRINPGNLAGELVSQVRPLFNDRSKKTLRWRIYNSLFGAVNSAESAQRLMSIMADMETTMR